MLLWVALSNKISQSLRSFEMTVPRTRNEKFKIAVLLGALVLMPAPGFSATGRILDDNEASLADATALSAEAELFKSIGMGIALAIYQCAEESACRPYVSKDELGHLLNTLDKRISDLAAREQEQQGAFTEVITVYVNQREDYLRYQNELDKFAGAEAGEEALAEGDMFGASGPGATPAATTEAGVDLSIFSDVDAPLEDIE